MIKDDPLDNTGFGISLEVQDNEHPFIEVTHNTQTVTIEGNSWKFSEYVALTEIPFDD